MPSTAARHSGLQQEVIKFYRECFRAARAKSAQSRPHFYAFIRTQFRAHDLKKNDFTSIEYLLRRGRRQLESYREPSIDDMHI
ncbi:hypothetical protein BC937DRAFT_91786 [Endogone sp. FLAS-F59071]|nr:hypothetical protein BC937DRAFT_91786 [Endogone sp. FLAS-F59071]|eukprot:RUS21700.1 hypothetical protein BC937DRAFT_91786 [Endogone sp. FLAS-F59071]